MVINSLETLAEAENFRYFITRKLPRYMMRVTYSSMHISRANFIFVPAMDFHQKWTDRDFMEHQANVYAASVLMPRPTFVPFVMELNRKAGYKDGVFVRPPVDPFFQYRHWYTFLEEIGQKIAETFGVSESAAYVHMKRCGLIRTEDPKELPLYIRRGIAV